MASRKGNEPGDFSTAGLNHLHRDQLHFKSWRTARRALVHRQSPGGLIGLFPASHRNARRADALGLVGAVPAVTEADLR